MDKFWIKGFRGKRWFSVQLVNNPDLPTGKAGHFNVTRVKGLGAFITFRIGHVWLDIDILP